MNNIVFHGVIACDREECFADLYKSYKCHYPEMSFREMLFIVPKGKQRDAIQKYVRAILGTEYAHPSITNEVIQRSYRAEKFMVPYTCTFPSKVELNRYKLQHPNMFHTMRDTQ